MQYIIETSPIIDFQKIIFNLVASKGRKNINIFQFSILFIILPQTYEIELR